MPMATMSRALAPAFCMAPRQHSTVVRHRSSGSCSTSPSAGKCCGNSCCAKAATEVSARNRLARVDVVPWSMLKTYDVTRASRPTHGLHNTMIYRHRDLTFAGGAGVADLGSERQQGLGRDAGGRQRHSAGVAPRHGSRFLRLLIQLKDLTVLKRADFSVFT